MLPILSGKVYEKTKHDVNELVRDEMALKLNETRSDRALEYADMLLHVAQKKGHATVLSKTTLKILHLEILDVQRRNNAPRSGFNAI